MSEYFINIATWGTSSPEIIDETTILQAEENIIDVNADDYTFLCQADSLEGAKKYYFDVEFQNYCFDTLSEKYHF